MLPLPPPPEKGRGKEGGTQLTLVEVEGDPLASFYLQVSDFQKGLGSWGDQEEQGLVCSSWAYWEACLPLEGFFSFGV